MNREQFAQATVIAMDSGISLSHVDDGIFLGCGLPGFQPVNVTIRQVARLIRWQCVQFNGELDAREYDELARLARRLFRVCD